MLWLYQCLSWLLLPVLPLLYVVPTLRSFFSERLSLATVEVEPGGVWIHAASLGEGRIAAALISAIRRSSDIPVFRSCSSANAREVSVGADQTLMIPFDSAPLMGRLLDRLRPRVLILVEAELWPGLIAACASRRIPVWVVGARRGPGLDRLLKIPGLWQSIKEKIRWIPVDAAAAAIGGGEPCGDLKAAAEAPVSPIFWRGEAVIGACTYAEEEEMLRTAVRALEPSPLLVLAPREPARFEEVARWLEASGEPWVRRSALTAAGVHAGTKVLLLDSLGELAGLYGQARVAFIGGTFLPRIGGHSPAEAAAAGCPVVHGPFTRSNAAAFDGMETFLAHEPEDLAEALQEAWTAPRPAGTAVAARQRIGRIVEQIEADFSRPVPPEAALRPLLWPLALLWLLVTQLRPQPKKKAAIPVISVGGLTAGGSGKTPVAGWIVEKLLTISGREPVVVGRGYGRRPGSEVRTDGEAAEIGDELCMLARRGLRVFSCPDRVAAVNEAARLGAGVAVLDDAFQYRKIAKNLEVVVIDARHPLGGGPIPVGTRRVPLAWLKEADVVWVNHGPLPEVLRPWLRENVVIVQARYRPVCWLRRGQRIPLDGLPDRPRVAMAGIARPEGFFTLLRQMGVTLERQWSYPDHHAFSWMDLQRFEGWLDDHLLLTTEKDAARLPRDLGLHALLLEPEILEGEEALLQKLRDLVSDP